MTSSTDREILTTAQEKGAFATFISFFRLSGPGWLQSAITLGGGSLGSALYLGVLGGYEMLWLQLIAIFVGVVMLSAISYVTLSTGKRPYEAINDYVNPVLGVGWVVATILANMIWCMPQFSLCFDVIDKNLVGGNSLGDANSTKLMVSLGLFVLAFAMVYLSTTKGLLSKIFDIVLKLIVPVIIVSFVAVVVVLFQKGEITAEIFRGFIPNLNQFFEPAARVNELITTLPAADQEAWKTTLVNSQRNTMISAVAAAVGINMTFLLPYSMLSRGWDKPFRGLARFDLITGMAIPFVLVTSCIVIASAFSFHGKADEALSSNDANQVQESIFFEKCSGKFESILRADELKTDEGVSVFAEVDETQKEVDAMTAAEMKLIQDKRPETTLGGVLFELKNFLNEPKPSEELKKLRDKLKTQKATVIAENISEVSVEERLLTVATLKPSGDQLAKSLQSIMTKEQANLVFGIGALGMGFSTIIILMMINGFAVREIFGRPDSVYLNLFGALLAGIVGVLWIWVWQGQSKTWAIILASTFGAMLLPIAYVAFFALMNSKSLLGDEKPTGIRMGIWNVLMLCGVLVASANACLAIYQKLNQTGGMVVLGAVITFSILALVGFSAKRK